MKEWQGIDIVLPRGGVMTGRVTDELGEPYACGATCDGGRLCRRWSA